MTLLHLGPDLDIILGWDWISSYDLRLGGRLRLRSRNSSRTHVLHAFVHLRTFFVFFLKRCVFIVLMTIASDPPNSAFLSETYCFFGDKKDFQFGQRILNFMNSCVKSFCFYRLPAEYLRCAFASWVKCLLGCIVLKTFFSDQ